jgi:hypothetical protein
MSTFFLDDQPCNQPVGCSFCPAQSPLAGAVRRHRAHFQISLEGAAEGAGLPVEQWEQLEAGTWIPATYAERWAVTCGLEGADLAAVSFWAFCSQEGVRLDTCCC